MPFLEVRARKGPAVARQPMNERTCNVLLLDTLVQLGRRDAIDAWFASLPIVDDLLMSREFTWNRRKRSVGTPFASKTRSEPRNRRS